MDVGAPFEGFAQTENRAPLPPLSQSDVAPYARRYRGLDELNEAWQALVAAGARATIGGETVQGRPIPLLEVGPPEADRVVVVLGGIHAQEWIGVEVATTVLTRLVATPPKDRRVLAFPVVNVDGFARLEALLRQRRVRFVRANANRVDLNRNWPTFYRTPYLVGHVLRWLGHSGAGPKSEPEVKSVLDRLDEARAAGATIERALSLHSFGRMILTPWGGTWRRPEAAQALRRAAFAIRDHVEPRYRPVQVSRWVPGFSSAPGMELDHLHAEYGAIAVLVECSRGGLRVTDPGSWLVPFRWFNPPDPVPECAALAPALDRFVRGADD